MAMDKRSVESAAIEAEINEIQSLGLDALRTRGRATFGRTPRADLTKNVIGRMIAWRIQKQAFGGLDRETLKLLEDLIRGKNDGLEGKLRLWLGDILVALNFSRASRRELPCAQP